MTQTTLESKGSELRDLLSNVDLRNISLFDVGRIGGQLALRGEISDHAAAMFAALQFTEDNVDPYKPMDAIKFLEDYYESVDSLINSGEQGYDEALNIAIDALHNMYNADTFIHSTRDSLHIDATV